jgi:hypothetical protein
MKFLPARNDSVSDVLLWLAIAGVGLIPVIGRKTTDSPANMATLATILAL